MKHLQVAPRIGFHVLASTGRSQAAIMVLDVGSSTGGPTNRHPDSDQWLYVISGEGTAIVDGNEVNLQPGSLLLIAAGENHEIRTTGQHPLETLNVYAPPEY